ncbi:3-oxo-5-alpha-steroid 4-dehydrogenase [Phlyctema vagabunda]|uniref:3-oxo-5-alpha-steroid 4-dehydrogenase n=1 Tax=Phlyctema vagabunda TaxID=108571 RepID=A0ABR4PQ28_9HELO
MASQGPITLKVTPAKKPIKRLPSSVEISSKSTVQDVKDQLARAAGIRDPNRLGISNPQSKKMLTNRLATVSEIADVLAAGEILVKDLGPQISWQLVFVIEYAGPIFIHLAFAALRPYLYSNVRAISTSQLLSLGMIVLHFLKREYETLFVHRFSLATMPARNIFKNCLHYWLLSGLYVAYFIYKPTSYTALSGPTITLINAVGLALYAFGELANLYTHRVLSNLRSPGGTERGIPQGFGFGLVTCPNYMFETLAWVGMILVSKSLSTAVFTAIGLAQMQQWAVGKEKKYREEFGDKYKKKRYPVIPSPGAVIKAATS